MRRNAISLALGALAAAGVFAACTGPSGNSLPAGTVPAANSIHGLVPEATGTYNIRHVFAGLTFDGTTFAVETHRSCGHRGLGGITPYVAPTTGPLALTASLSLAPMCVPEHAKVSGDVYIFAIAKHGSGSGKGADAAHWGGVPIAGPAAITDNPWVFAPLSPGLTMTGGQKYDFVVATSWQHPSPEPSASSSP
ncbi:MAG TPA: hypothetical protein VFE36_14320 [Candidatus Baltobacteraceae bacterium]|nr:hypothetical protein [Candidatus Baltobacteraceae bacterium]